MLWTPAFAGALVAACGPADDGDDVAIAETDPLLEAEAAARAELAESGLVNCAVGGESGFRPVCTIEQVQSDEGVILTLRHPDGGFRRLLVTNDGRGVIAADGAEPAEVTPMSGNQIEVVIADDRYRLPATVR